MKYMKNTLHPNQALFTVLQVVREGVLADRAFWRDSHVGGPLSVPHQQLRSGRHNLTSYHRVGHARLPHRLPLQHQPDRAEERGHSRRRQHPSIPSATSAESCVQRRPR